MTGSRTLLLTQQVRLETCFAFSWATRRLQFVPLEGAAVVLAMRAPDSGGDEHCVVSGQDEGYKRGSSRLLFLDLCSAVLRLFPGR